MQDIQPPTPWHGRDDQEEAPLARRWHHQVSLATQEAAAADDSLGLIGFCCDAGVQRNLGRPGAAQGPSALRRQLGNLAWHGGEQRLLDFGDVLVAGDELERGQQRLAEQVALALGQVRRLLVVGGGHETAFGSFCGLRQALGSEARIGIINLDAHFDLRRPGARGVSSGTPFFQIRECVGAQQFHYCCLGVAREANTEALFRRADAWGVRYREDRAMSLAHLTQIKAELAAFAEGLDALYLTLDLDVLPHYQAPGVSAPAVRGVALEVIEAVIDQVIALSAQCPLGLPLVELTELNPSFDPQGVTARTAAVLAGRMLTPL